MEKVILIDADTQDLDFSLAAGEQLTLVLFILPASVSLARASVPPASGATDGWVIPVRVRLEGAGADFQLHALCLCSGREKVSVSVQLEHRVPDASSQQLIRCIAGGESRITFDGRIKVCSGAQRTTAFQTSNNILLSERAKVRTQPQLEIYADDVKCSHGATTGTLDEDEQFYMRSRGITLEQARLLQLRSFVWPVLAAVSDEKLRAELDGRIQEVLSRL